MSSKDTLNITRVNKPTKINIMELRAYYMRADDQNKTEGDIIEIAINDLMKKLKLS